MHRSVVTPHIISHNAPHRQPPKRGISHIFYSTRHTHFAQCLCGRGALLPATRKRKCEKISCTRRKKIARTNATRNAAQAASIAERKPRGSRQASDVSDARTTHTPQTSHFEQRQGRAKHHTLSNAHNLTTDNLSTRHVHKLLITMPSCKQVINKLSTWR